MTNFDRIVASATALGMFALVVFGGLFYPNTLAGKVAAFVFSATN